MAALMVVTAAPLGAFVAPAKQAEPSSSYTYLTSGIDGDFTNVGSVTWDGTENAARFNGSNYLKIDNFDAFANVTSSTGFAISFDFKKTSSNPNWGFVFALTSGNSNDNRFTFNAGSNTDNEWNRGLTFAVVNGAYNSYYSNDFANSDHCSTTGATWKPDNDTWYNVTLHMDTTGAFTYYVNNTFMGTFRADYNNSSNGANAGSVVENAIHNFNTLYIGCGATASECLNGYVKNITFLGCSAPNNANSLKALKTAIDTYEEKMADGTIYTNLSAAYSKYQQACARYDAYVYGELDLSNATNAGYIATAAAELEQATLNMKPWVAYTANNPDAADGSYTSSNLVANDEMKNVLYTYGVSGDSAYNNSTSISKCIVGFQYGAIVFLYNGTEMACPINAYVSRNGSGTRRCRSIDPTTSGFSLKHNWHSNESTGNTTYQGTTGVISYVDGDTANASLNMGSGNYYYSNTLYLNLASMSNYSASYTPTFRFRDNNGNQGSNTTGGVVNQGDQTIYVLNYKALTDEINTQKSKVAGITVSNYKEGGLATIFADFDDATSFDPNSYFSSGVTIDNVTANTSAAKRVESAATEISGIITQISSHTSTADSNYPALRAAIDATRTIEGTSYTTTSAYNGGNNTAGFTSSTWTPFVSAYEAARTAMAGLYNQNSYPATSQSQTTGDLNTAFANLVIGISTPPTVSPNGGLIGFENDGTTRNNVTITNPLYSDSGVTLSYTFTYDDSTTETGNIAAGVENTTVNPFSITGHENASTATLVATATKSGNSISTSSITFTNAKVPTVADPVVARGSGVYSSIASGNGTANAVYQYSADGTNWTDLTSSSDYVPFSGSAATASTDTIYLREKYSSTVFSAATSVTFVRQGGGLPVVATYTEDGNSVTSSSEYKDGATFSIPNASTYSETIHYTMKVDGVADPKVHDYSAPFSIGNSNFVEFTVWAGSLTSQTTVSSLFNKDTYNPLAYHESFTGGTVSNGTNFTTGMTTGLNATASGTISVEAGAGTKSSDTESYSWRNNVLKINANATAPGPVVTLADNPLKQGINKTAALANGVTISFWRHIEDASGNTVNLATTQWNDTGYNWRNAIAFQKNGDNSKYYILEVNGVNSFRIDDSNYMDFVPENQDNTGHEEGNDNGEWEHVAVTIDPTNGVKVYTNGVEHDTKYIKLCEGGTVTTTTTTDHDNPLDTTASAAYADELLEFLTDATTQITFDNGVMWEGNEYNLFLDDIRIYTQPLTQVDINNMYTDNLADVQTNVTSTSHDPSTVTVYTLKTATNGKEAGSKVGQEFIDYYNVPASNYTVEYYSFGTGMTIYKAGETFTTVTGDKQIRWMVLGDSEGRCGYQNEELFGAKYTTALSDVRKYLGVNLSTGAGYLVWAPHVMYNLTLNKWVYYAAMSSWGAVKSATFYATSDDPTSGYQYQGMIYKSNSLHPNAIDSCIFYGHNSDGSINKDELYMVIGSWGHTHNAGRYDAIYGVQINANGSAAPSMANTPDSLEVPGTTFEGTNGTYTSYALVRGYTGDLENDSGRTTEPTTQEEWDEYNSHNGESAGSGEGAYVQYINGFYYLFVSYGQNEGSYTERVFRSETPLGTGAANGYTAYVGSNGFQANDDTVIPYNQRPKTRGDQLLAPFDISVYTKRYRSTGHNSVYMAYNEDGEAVWINAVHARPNATAEHNWTAVQDNALAKRQSGGVKGNVCLNNLLGVTNQGWLVMFPYQYNGTDSPYKEVKASQLEGIYYGNNMRMKVDSTFSSEYRYTFLANLDDSTDTTGVVFGTIGSNEFRMKFKLDYADDGTGQYVQYIELYNDSATYAQILADQVNPIHEGVIAIHEKNGVAIPMLATLNIDTTSSECGMHFWAYRMGDIPDVGDVVSNGDQVSMDGVIYTHATDAEALSIYGATAGTDAGNLALKSAYSLYGQEISDNWTYGQKDANGYFISGGERFTTITTKYPNYIDPNAVSPIISLDDTEYCRTYGETGSNMQLQPLNSGYWCTKSGTTYTPVYADDASAQAAVQADPNLELYKVYGITGKVSSFFRYYNNEADGSGQVRNGYPEIGVTLVVSYKDCETGNSYSEFEFCYVEPNPAWAHTIAATKNGHTDLGNDRNSSYGIFNRFVGSYGEATAYDSSFLRYASKGTTDLNGNGQEDPDEVGWGYGTSGYLSDFTTHSFSDTDLDTLDEIKTLMNKSPNAHSGVNSGSFAAWTHVDDCPNAFTAAPQLINTQYYIDYSDKSNYIANNPNTGLITSTNGVPTGYEFKMRTSNFLWANYSGSSIFDVTSYAKNDTGLNVTYSSTAAAPESSQPYRKSDGDGAYNSSFTAAMIYDTNYQEVKSSNGGTGNTAFKEDGFLFMTDERSSSDAIFSTNYRNKFLYYFSSGTNYNLIWPVDGPSNRGKNIFDGTGHGANPPATMQIYDFRQNQAYTTASNGKLSTNAWQGTATFTGKDTLKQNTVADLQTIGNASSSDTLVYEDGRLYDGYYYYTNEHNDIKREHWAATQSEAESKTVTTSGRIDVTAENMANYILEMGNYHKITDIGADGGRFIGSDTYHYYNIGVATCDKGAVRDFLENFELKELVTTTDADGHKHVTLDANGRPTIDTSKNGGDINVDSISIASYEDYINAIARLEWFVKNPQNTMQNDLADVDKYSDVAAIQSAGSDDYTTAYASGVAIYKANTTSTDIFGSGTTTTDDVQAELIADVLEAYETLFRVEDYEEVEATFIANKDTLVAEVQDDSTHTTESVETYREILRLFTTECSYYTDENAKTDIGIIYDGTELDDLGNTETYWRYVTLSGMEYRDILDTLKHLDEVLMLKVAEDGSTEATGASTEGSNIIGAITNKGPSVTAGIYTGATQTSTLDSWLALNTAYNEAITSRDDNEGLARYANGAEKTITFSSQSVTYYVPDTSTLSEYQQDVIDKTAALNAAALVGVDTAEAYSNYDSAYTVISASLDYDKYVGGEATSGDAEHKDAYDLISEKLQKRLSVRGESAVPTVYVTPTADDVAAYTAATGGDLATTTELKNLAVNEVDVYTADLLNEINYVNDVDNGYVKQFAGTVQVFDTDGETPLSGFESPVALTNAARDDSTVFYYGDTYEVPIPEPARGKCEISVTYKDPYNNNATIGSQKVNYNGSSFTKNAISDMIVTITLTEKPAAENYKVIIKNMYGATVNTVYVAKSTLDDLIAGENWGINKTLDFGSGNTVTAPYVPFYTFTTWKCSMNDAESTATFKPYYNAGQSVTLNINGSSSVTGASYDSEAGAYKAAFDNLVTITGPSGTYGWATLMNDKYQIAAYGDTVSLNAVTAETFYPITTDGEYYYANSTMLTSSNVDVKFTVDAVAADDLLNQKLAAKNPFVSAIAVTGETNENSKLSSATVYCRVTTGSGTTSYTDIGCLATTRAANGTDATMVKPTVQAFKTSTVRPNGQYSYTISSSGSGFAEMYFRGYISYDLTYNYVDDGTPSTAQVNVAEYSKTILRQQPTLGA